MKKSYALKTAKIAATLCATTLFAKANTMPVSAENTGVSEMGGY